MALSASSRKTSAKPEQSPPMPTDSVFTHLETFQVRLFKVATLVGEPLLLLCSVCWVLSTLFPRSIPLAPYPFAGMAIAVVLLLPQTMARAYTLRRSNRSGIRQFSQLMLILVMVALCPSVLSPVLDHLPWWAAMQMVLLTGYSFLTLVYHFLLTLIWKSA